MIIRIFTIFLLLPFSVFAASTNYFVLTNGNDSANGTSWATAFLTIAQANSVVKSGNNDTITVGQGRFAERIVVLKSNVTFIASNIAVTAASAPTISSNIYVASSGPLTSMKGFDIENNSVTVRGFEITQITNGQVVAINVYANTTNTLIELNYIHNTEAGAGSEPYAIHLRDATCDSVTIRSNLLYQVEGIGIGVVGNGNWIEANEVSHGRNMNSLGVKVLSDCDTSRCLGTKNVFTNNFFHDYLMEEQFFETPVSAMPHIDGCMIFTEGSGILCSNITFVANTFKNLGDQAIIVRDIYTNYGLITNIFLYNNVFWNCGQGSYSLNMHDSPGDSVIGNVFLSNVGPYFWSSNANLGTNYYLMFPYRWDQEQQTGGKYLTLEDNIFYGFGSNYTPTIDIWSLTNSVIDFNLWYPAPNGIPIASPNDVNTITNKNPQFKALGSDYHLTGSSPGILVGTNLVTILRFDRDNVSRPLAGTNWDIGAYQYLVASGSPEIFINPSSLSYGTLIRVGAPSLSITVSNAGGGTLNGNATSDSGNFVVTAGSGYGIAGGTAASVTVKFAPAGVAGTYSGNLTLTGGGGAVVPMSGVATNFPTVKIQ